MKRAHLSTKQKHSYGYSFDWTIFSLAVFLTLFGVLMVYNASVAQAFRDFGDKYYFLKRQIFWAVLSLGSMVFFSFFDYRRFKKIAPMILGVVIFLLILVFLPGIGSKVKGAHRWIPLGGFNLQPAEIAKLSLIIYFSAFFSSMKKKSVDFKRFLTVVGIILFLVMLEPDMGTTIVLVSVAFILYFIGGGSMKHFLLVIPFGFLIGVGLIFIAPYRLHRLETFFSTLIDPTSVNDPLGTSYHIRQALIGIGSGGFFGVGLGMSRQKYEYLPEASTDSIFAVIGEELGFLGGVVLILLFLFLIYKGFEVAKNTSDSFGKFLAYGITSYIAVQMLVNLGAMVAIVPLTGVPLPFVSYGGSALLTTLSAVGILLNISRNGGRA